MVTEGGICTYNGSQWFEFDINDGLAGPVVRALDIAPNNDVWVATSTGVTKVNNHSLGLSKNETTSFSVCPNPVNSIVTINIDKTYTDQMVIEIYSVSLQKVKSIILPSNQSELVLNLEDLENGMYIIKLGNISKKIIKN